MFPGLTERDKWILAGVGILILFGPQISKALASKVAEQATGAVIDGATGAVIGIGKGVGIPETNITQCQKDLQAGNMWAASFSCPAADFVKGMINRL
jgi:hypothetical protein